MIYQEPRFALAGDRFVEMELGDELSFDLNLRVHSLAAAIRASGISGVVEIVPVIASILISYDWRRISHADLVVEMKRLHASLGPVEEMELESRIVYVPVLYFDPWTRACYDEYCAKVTKKEFDVDILLRLNNLRDRAELVRRHSGTEYWVAALGFWPGLASLMPLDPRCRLTAPKYNPPRSWTWTGTIGHGGSIAAIYPDQTPGGYQMFARTPVPVQDKKQRLPAFRDSIALLRPGDRVRFYPVDRDEYDHIEAEVEAGTYEHQVVAYQKFSIGLYQRWLADIGSVARAAS